MGACVSGRSSGVQPGMDGRGYTDIETPRRDDTCGICQDQLREARVLPCNHVFCLTCLGYVRRGTSLKCFICEKITKVAAGMKLDDLPRYVKDVTGGTLRLRRVVRVQTNDDINDVAVDEEDEIIYVSKHRKNATIKMFDYKGGVKGQLGKNLKLHKPRICLDSKRRLLITSSVGVTSLFLFDTTSQELARKLTNSQFECLGRVSYHGNTDRYLVIDTYVRCVFILHADSGDVITTLPMTFCQCTRIYDDVYSQNALLCASASRDQTTWAVSDINTGTVYIHGADGEVVQKTFPHKGAAPAGSSMLQGMCWDESGALVVCDFLDKRLMSLSPGGGSEWQVILTWDDPLLGLPTNIHITKSGMIIMTSTLVDNNPAEEMQLFGCLTVYKGYPS